MVNTIQFVKYNITILSSSLFHPVPTINHFIGHHRVNLTLIIIIIHADFRFIS